MSDNKEQIRQIQYAVGVTPDGVFGPKTAAAVLSALEKKGRNG